MGFGIQGNGRRGMQKFVESQFFAAKNLSGLRNRDFGAGGRGGFGGGFEFGETVDKEFSVSPDDGKIVHGIAEVIDVFIHLADGFDFEPMGVHVLERRFGGPQTCFHKRLRGFSSVAIVGAVMDIETHGRGSSRRAEEDLIREAIVDR